MSDTAKGMLSVAACAILWSTAGVLIKLIPWNAMVIGSARSAIAAIVLWLTLWCNGCKKPVLNRQTALSGFFFGTTLLLFVLGNKLTAAANVIALQSSNPVFVLLYSAILFKQRIARRDMFVVGLTSMGIVLFFFEEFTFGGFIGNIVSLLSAVTLADGFLCATGARNYIETMSGVFWGFIISAMIGFPFFFLNPPIITYASVSAILFLGVFQLGLAYALFSYGARRCSPLAISLIVMLELVFSVVWVALFLKEFPSYFAIAGGLVIVLTVLTWCADNAMHGKRARLHHDNAIE